MKLAIATILAGSAAAFAPGASFSGRNTALNMAETATETKVRKIEDTFCIGTGNMNRKGHIYKLK